uniref:Exostosin GT47 domain-containing protein n=1 Tax=Davidia involucrata TaxID=16924 RepID=A0A5B7BUN7_DAVIN
MGHESRYLCKVETRRLLWLMGMVLAAVLVVHYFELPYVHVISSLFSASKAQTLEIGSLPTGDSSHYPKMLVNVTPSNVLNSTDTDAVHETVNVTKISEGNDIGLKNDSVSESEGGSDDSIELDEDSDPEDESSSVDFVELDHNSTVEMMKPENALAPEKAGQSEYSFSRNNVTTNYNPLLGKTHGEDNSFTSEKNESLDVGLRTPSFSLQPIISSPNFTLPSNLGTKSITPVISVNPNTSSADKDLANTLPNVENPGLLQSVLTPSDNNFSITNVPVVNTRSKEPTAAVVSISEMNGLLLQNRASSSSMKPRWSSAVDQDLLNAKSLIENAPIIGNDPGLYAPLYRNVSMFKRSYELMEQTLKVYIYREGERPIFHQQVLKGIYASEGWFMRLLKANKQFVTKNPKKAHLFYLPFSSRMLEETLYVPNSHSHKNLIQYLKNYLDMIVARYTFWNRTGGADHFLVACHDWAPSETKRHMANCIRALCNSDIKEGFKFGKDVSLPETYVHSAQNPLRQLGGRPPSQRRILAFFAGNMHGYLRPILLQHWENKDPDMKIFGRMPKVKKGKMNYVQHMKSSKYCICAKGYEVNSPRVVEAIFYECVPVIISDNFVPPFFEVLNWESFAVFVPEKDIPNLKNILLSISAKRYLEMQQRVKKVQQHFLWHTRPVKYDIFHMILHSIWYNRVFQIRPR